MSSNNHNAPISYGLDPSTSAHEQARLDSQHVVWTLMLDGSLTAVPLPRGPKSVLDVGAGTGIWACEFARQNRECHVWATDLEVPELKDRPENLTWIQADAEDDWGGGFEGVTPAVPEGGFDYIHIRLLTFGCHDWAELMRKCWRYLKPGGVLEILDIGTRTEYVQADERDRVALEKFYTRWHEGALRLGFDREDCGDHRAKLRAQGFEVVRSDTVMRPLQIWEGLSEKESQIGKLTLENLRRGYPIIVKNFISSGDGMNEQEMQELGEHAVAALGRCWLRQPCTINVARKPVKS